MKNASAAKATVKVTEIKPSSYRILAQLWDVKTSLRSIAELNRVSYSLVRTIYMRAREQGVPVPERSSMRGKYPRNQ